MLPTNDIAVFAQKNDAEFRALVRKQCEYLDYPGSPDDVVQELYVKFLTKKKIIEAYDPSYNVQISSYLFKIIRNFIITRVKSHDGRFRRCRVLTPSPTDDTNEFDLIPAYYDVSDDFYDNQYFNNNSFMEEFSDFERQFSKSPQNIKFKLRKRQHKNTSLNFLKILERLQKRGKIGEEFNEIKDLITEIEENGCTLLDLFRLLYKGYNNKMIARIYGVSTTTISAMKSKLAKAMIKYGIKYDRATVSKVSIQS